ncbi:MAG TPA: sensor histidine kinase [Thermoleophilaceae bacterium]
MKRLAERHRDVAIFALLFVLAEANVAGTGETENGRDPALALDLLAAAALTVPLLWRRRAPLAMAIAVMLAALGQTLWLTQPPDVFAETLVAAVTMFSLGHHAESRQAWIGIVVSAAIAVAISVVYDPADIVFPVVFFFLLPWAAGRVLRGRLLLARELAEKAARLEAEREERAARAVADERARIARELHDVVAHSLTVMVIQAGAARRLVDRDPERVVEVAATIRQMGREALDEMRRLVGVLAEEQGAPALAPQPTMADLESLVERARSAGLDVEVSVRGERAELPPGVDLAAYRVVQEALTNTVKHAHARHASVAVTYGGDELELCVSDDGSGSAAGESAAVPGGGHGLVGMRERVTLYGGELVAGEREGGGFEVRVRFPLREEAYA